MPDKPQSIISVIIINRNTESLLRNCLNSLPLSFSTIPYDVWVVDNGSDDGSVQMLAKDFPHVRLIRNKKNLGFAKANNQALKKLDTSYVLLLNSDTILGKNSVEHLYNFIDRHPEAAIACPKLVNGDGTLQASTYPIPRLYKDILLSSKLYRLLPKNLQAKLFLGSFWDHDQESKVGRVTGACILVRMSDMRSVNFFDESFFFYGEVHDLCWSLWKKSRETWLIPASEVIHLGGQTSKKLWDYREQRRRMWRENERLIRKHKHPATVRLHILLSWFGLLIGTISQSIPGSVAKATYTNKDLLKIDLDWYNNRLKEMFWYKTRHLYKLYFKLPIYTPKFYKRLFQKIGIEKARILEFKSETDHIQNELLKKWDKVSSDHRAGFMDFSCSTLLYHLIRWLKPLVVVETGVANGVSSTFILSAMEANRRGELYSIDWSEDHELAFLPDGMETGWMVPDGLRKRWHLETGRTEIKLAPLLERLREVDIFLHDSDHSYETMTYEYRTAWPYLVKYGLLISDDVKMNTAFVEFTKEIGCTSLTYQDRLGIAQKLD